MDFFQSIANSFSGLFAAGPQAARTSRASFSAVYKALPMAFADKDHLDVGNKVILPSSALAKLTRLNVEYPMMFTMVNNITKQKTHVGVIEFSAPEGIAFIPLSVMKFIQLETEAPVSFSSIVLPRGTFVKIQPHKTAFIELSNPKAVLERSLRSFSCLTSGETFTLVHADTEFDIDVLEVKPNLVGAISLIDTDVQVEFAAPKDYVEPSLPATSIAAQPASSSSGSIQYSAEKLEEKAASRPSDSPLSSRPGGYRLNSTSSGPLQSSQPTLDASNTSPVPARHITEVKGQWRYTYEIDPRTQRRRLVRRDPVTPGKSARASTGYSLR